jgi:transmembrane sensor
MNILRRKSAAGARRREQASWWFARLQDPDLPARVLKQWRKWEAVPENRQTFDEIVQLSGRLRAVRPLLALSAAVEDGYDGSISVHAWRLLQRPRITSRPGLRTAAAALGLAAAFALAAIGLKWGTEVSWSSILGGPRMLVAETAVGEHREVFLGDGSQISLGAKTAIAAELTDRVRTVVLTRGEALFRVKHDPSRPFRVIAGGGTVTAVGTAFNVRRREDDHVVVTVTEGTVEVSPGSPLETRASKLAGDIRRLVRGQEITYDLQGRFGAPRLADEAFSSDWRSGTLRYRGEPLRNVVPDVNRYSRKPLILGDKAAGELLYSGTVFERDVDEWVAGLQAIYPDIEVTVTDTQHVLIRTRPNTHQQQPH